MNASIFTTIILSDGSKCDILEVKPSTIWLATFKQQLNPDKQYDLVPFILEQVLIIDGKKVNMEYIGNMELSDYIEITEALNICMQKLENFQ